MDFPNVTLVVQVGLPSDADAYTHRVGRTARAGKDGRAVIILTDAESFYLRTNPQFPIKSHPASTHIQASLDSALPMIQVALQSAGPVAKGKAYSAYLGFMKTFMNQLRLNPTGLVQMANQFALEGMYCNEVPKLERKTVGYVKSSAPRPPRRDQPNLVVSFISANSTVSLGKWDLKGPLASLTLRMHRRLL